MVKRHREKSTNFVASQYLDLGLDTIKKQKEIEAIALYSLHRNTDCWKYYEDI